MLDFESYPLTIRPPYVTNLIWYFILFDALPAETKIDLSSNIKVASWLPQNDILGHNQTKLFINHGGANGLMEAAYHGVPMICAPFFGDQYDNAHLARRKGFAEVVNLDTITADELVEVIIKVISNHRYTARQSSYSTFYGRVFLIG